MPRLLLACLAAALLAPAAAHAGPAYVLGNTSNGSYPHVTAGAPGVFHVAWNDPAADSIVYCRVVATANGCQRSTAVHFNDDPGGSISGRPGPAWIVPGKTAGTLYLALANYVSAKTYVWTSTDDGVTFSGPVKVWGGPAANNGTDSERPLYLPAADSIVFPTWNVGLYAYEAKIDGSEGESSARASLDTSGMDPSQYRLNLATLSTGTLATADDLENLYFWQAPSGTDRDVKASWGAPNLIGPGTDSAMAGVDTSVYLASTVNQDGRGRFEIRRWNGTAFGAPVVVANDPGYVADIAVSQPAGRPGAVYRKNGTGLRYASSADDGATFTTKTISTGDEIYFDAQVARDDNGDGIVVWRRDGAIAAANLTEVADPSIPTVSRSVTKKRKTVGLNVPGSCVVPGTKFSATSGATGKGKVKKVVYTAAGASATDRKPRFGVKLTLPAATAPGATVPVKAVATIKRGGSTFKITVVNAIRACGG